MRSVCVTKLTAQGVGGRCGHGAGVDEMYSMIIDAVDSNEELSVARSEKVLFGVLYAIRIERSTPAI